MMNWKRPRWIWKVGLNAIERSSVKSRNGMMPRRGDAVTRRRGDRQASPRSCGSAAAQCGEARPHRLRPLRKKEAAPPGVEAEPRHRKLKRPFSVSQRLTGPCRGVASSLQRINRKLTTCATFRLLAVLLLLSAFCFLPTAFSSAQNEGGQAQLQPSPSPSPSPSPTPPPNLHQWGAVTLFHGLPSDRVHAIAQTTDGVMWFATDGGLARYDGRRTQAIIAEGLPPGRVLALKL